MQENNWMEIPYSLFKQRTVLREAKGFQAEDVQSGLRAKTFASPYKTKAFAMTTIVVLYCR